jgi:putative aldouronate transport system permease protein
VVTIGTAHRVDTPAEPPVIRTKPRRIKETPGYRVFQIVNAIILTLVVVVTLYPFLNVLARSFSSAAEITAGHVNLWPKGFNLTTYRDTIKNAEFWVDYRNTVVYTVVATAIALFLTTCYAYVLSKKHLKGRTLLIGIALFTMFFNGGLIPNYVLINHLGFRNTIWAVVLPNAISVFNLLVMKAFFENMPAELEEAAQVDGLNTYGILWRIVLPLSKAVLATMLLFYAVTYWNAWFGAFLYIDDGTKLPVTVYLRNLMFGTNDITNLNQPSEYSLQIAANIQSVVVILTALPIIMVYPFIQRYFVSGVMLGAVKG